jgi:EAL domain-containing protein (putative c-di-GMP-specific phosphodiesterase class I)/FixJ family two-component response regulator
MDRPPVSGSKRGVTLRSALAQVADARVLAVDDTVANTLLLKGILQKAGLHDVVEVNDPTEVVDQLETLAPDLVLLDLRMPGIDGFELLGHIQRFAAGTMLPVIIVSSDDSRASVSRALDLGAHDFLVKPVEARELVLRVRNLLLQRRAYQELRRSRAWLRTRLELFEPAIGAAVRDPEGVAAQIRAVLQGSQLRIALQPVVDMHTGASEGAEALVRFPSSSIGDTSAWLAAAQHVGLGVDVEVAAIRAALAHVGRFTVERPLAINASPAAVLADLVTALGPDVPWERVVLELTEHVPVEDYDVLNRALAPLRDAGARLSVDDTGAGFASLRHILDLHPDYIKLDVGIVRGVDHDPSRAAMAEMLIRFAERVGIKVVAEGVETESERATLLELGGTLGQGYLFGRPEVAL